MKYFPVFFILLITNLNAQNILNFDKRNVQCEDKWITYQMNKDSLYSYGYIYIDSQAGLTFNYEGDFKINKKGEIIKIESREKRAPGFMKVRLKPTRVAIAEIPESIFKELNIEKTPVWLKSYKGDENSIEHLFRWGYLYNGYEEIEKALTYLEKAEKINPNFKGLQTELAFSYNASGKFDKAVIALQKELNSNPNDCYSLKELAYAFNHLDKQDKTIETYNVMKSACNDKLYIQETAYNLAFIYYTNKDMINFEKWDNEARKWSDNENQFTKNLTQLEIEIKKK